VHCWAAVIMCYCQSVCLWHVYCDKTAEATIMLFSLKISSMPSLFSCEVWQWNLKAVPSVMTDRTLFVWEEYFYQAYQYCVMTFSARTQHSIRRNWMQYWSLVLKNCSRRLTKMKSFRYNNELKWLGIKPITSLSQVWHYNHQPTTLCNKEELNAELLK